MVPVIHVVRDPARVEDFLFRRFSRNWRNINSVVLVTTVFFCYDFFCFQVI